MKRGLWFCILGMLVLLSAVSTELRAANPDNTTTTKTSTTNNDPKDKSLAIKSIYPNPVHAELNIELTSTISKDVQILIFNLLGQQVSDLGEHHVSDFDVNTLTFDVSDIKAGLYIVMVKSDTTLKSVKMKKVQ
ncbi:MAG: T9SS type A sorting domain-containing protein [Bacteroidales bacterium]